MLHALVATHLVLGLVALLGARRLGRRALILGGIAPAATVAAVASRLGAVRSDGAVDAPRSWIPQLDLSLDLRLDAFSVLMVALVSGVGTLVFAYAWHYFGPSSPVAGRAAGLLTVFAGAMLGVVLADDLLLLYVCWELTSVTSYLLIGLDHESPEGRSAALHALLVTGAGGLAMLGGFVLLGHEAGTTKLSEILADPPAGGATSVALVLILLGALTKSAQYPFHSWLSGAMVAPTPISAYLHSAAMVKAGVYLIARLSPAFAVAGPWRPIVVTAGLVTMVAGGLRALRPTDLKQLLAFGTISQLGFLVVLFGIGIPEATTAGCALLLAHALFKAALFMVVGIVDHELHTRDIRTLPRLGAGWRPVRVVAALSAASMAAVPPLAGFLAKDEAYAALLHGEAWHRAVLAGVVAGSVLTVAYSCRFAAAVLRPDLLVARDRPRTEHPPHRGFVWSGAGLAALTLALGLVPAVWSGLVDRAANALDPDAHAHLALWHGLEAPLLLSLLTLSLGLGLFAGRRRVAALQGALAPRTTGTERYEHLVRGMLHGAGAVTRVVQSGSLPAYTTIIFASAAAAPVVALLAGTWWPGWPVLAATGWHLPIALLLAAGSLAVVVARRRFAAALLLGVVGYGMAMLFVLHGAPDLALTQIAVETLSVVVFLLVLRRLPDRFERRRPAVHQAVRVGVAAAVGAMVVILGVAASGWRTAPPVSTEMVERAYPDGEGKNIVNVILVDIRGLDTLGEVTVLATAAIGITAIARAGRRPGRAPTAPAESAPTAEAQP